VSSLNGATEATRDLLDTDRTINQVFRNIYTLDWKPSVTTFDIIASLPHGTGFILYGEAWYGLQDQNQPSGNRAASFCKEGVSIDGDSAGSHLEFRFRPGT